MRKGIKHVKIRLQTSPMSIFCAEKKVFERALGFCAPEYDNYRMRA